MYIVVFAAMATLDSASAVPHQRYAVTSLPAPPEDILSQWRLRRKMEQASEQCQSRQNSRLCTPTYRGPGPSLHFSTLNLHPYKVGVIVTAFLICRTPMVQFILYSAQSYHNYSNK